MAIYTPMTDVLKIYFIPLLANPVQHSVSTITHMCGIRIKGGKNEKKKTSRIHRRDTTTPSNQHMNECDVNVCEPMATTAATYTVSQT